MAMNSKYTENESGMRGTKIVQQFGRDRSDEMPSDMSAARNGNLKGDVGNISPMISNGKVPKE